MRYESGAVDFMGAASECFEMCVNELMVSAQFAFIRDAEGVVFHAKTGSECAQFEKTLFDGGSCEKRLGVNGVSAVDDKDWVEFGIAELVSVEGVVTFWVDT